MNNFFQSYLGVLGIFLLIGIIIYMLPWDFQGIYLVYIAGFTVLAMFFSIFQKREKVQPISLTFLTIFSFLSIIIGLILQVFPFSPIAMFNGREFFSIACISLFLQSLFQIYRYLNRPKSMKFRKVLFPFFISLSILSIKGIPLSTQFPRPSGTFAVGTKAYYFQDLSRKEVLTNDPNDFRELMLQVNYPIDFDEKHKPTYYKSSRRIRTNTYENVHFTKKEEYFPLIIYSSGAGATRYDNTQLVEELVSHGYVVIAIDHTFFNNVHFPDKRRIKAHSMDISQKKFSKESFMQEIVLKTRVLDIQHVFAHILEMNQDSSTFLFNRIDFENVGVLGWSIGGAAAGNICTIDPRFKAGINLDGWDWMKMEDTTTYLAPFMYIQSDRAEIGWKELFLAGMRKSSFEERELMQAKYEKQLFSNSQEKVLKLRIKGSMHSNFRDHGFIGLGQLGSGDAHKITQFTHEYVLAFFDLYLRGKKTLIFTKDYPHPEEVLFNSNFHEK